MTRGGLPLKHPITRAEVEVQGRRISYLAAGNPDAPAVILLHGGGIDGAWVSWRHVIPALAHTHHVLAPDLPGYGPSAPPPPGQPYTTAYLIETVAAFRDVLCIDRAALAGLSMGGVTALGLTLAAPERVTRLALVDSYGLQDVPAWRPLSVWALNLPDALPNLAWWLAAHVPLLRQLGLAVIFRDPRRLTPEILDDAADNVRLAYFYAWLRHELASGSARTNYTPQLPALNVPTLLLHGAHDPSIPLKWAVRAAARLPYSQLLVIDGAGHWPNRERPHVVNAHLVRFLAE